MNQPRELIDKYVQYINGDGGRPKKEMKKYEPTLISLSRKEKAKNKPLVECKIGNEKVKTMFDTGADLNVISQELAEKLVKQNSAIKIYISNTRETCANGSVETCSGKVQLNVVIGPVVDRKSVV